MVPNINHFETGNLYIAPHTQIFATGPEPPRVNMASQGNAAIAGQMDKQGIESIPNKFMQKPRESHHRASESNRPEPSLL
jgi:hypothetical protein